MRIREMKGGFAGRLRLALALLLAAFIALTGCGGSGPKAASEPAKAEGAREESLPALGEGEASLPQGEESEGQEEAAPAELSFKEKDIHSGDLILVNSTYPYDFDANAETVSLVNILERQGYDYQVEKEEYSVAERILPSLDAMVATCDAAMGTQLTGITSAYRSYEYQQGVMEEITGLYGESYAKRYVATPGFSEHHTGLAVDIGIFYPDGSQGSFSESENAAWMRQNCWQYGFIRRYAEDKVEITGISNEAWHFRYVGLPHAYYMAEHGLCLEEYIYFLREETSKSDPLLISCEGKEYQVFFTPELKIAEPEGPYQVSGDNIDGLIVTVG